MFVLDVGNQWQSTQIVASRESKCDVLFEFSEVGMDDADQL